MLLWFLVAAITLIWLYIIVIRPQLRKRFPQVWGKLDEIELWLFRGSRTFIVSRLTIVFSVIIGVHDFLASIGFDYTPFLEQIKQHVDAKYWPLLIPLSLAAYGLMHEFIKRTQASESTAPDQQ